MVQTWIYLVCYPAPQIRISKKRPSEFLPSQIFPSSHVRTSLNIIIVSCSKLMYRLVVRLSGFHHQHHHHFQNMLRGWIYFVWLASWNCYYQQRETSIKIFSPCDTCHMCNKWVSWQVQITIFKTCFWDKYFVWIAFKKNIFIPPTSEALLGVGKKKTFF